MDLRRQVCPTCGRSQSVEASCVGNYVTCVCGRQYQTRFRRAILIPQDRDANAKLSKVTSEDPENEQWETLLESKPDLKENLVKMPLIQGSVLGSLIVLLILAVYFIKQH